MTHRERVLAALRHEEPDRVPIDLGGTLASTIVGSAYPRLREALGLAGHEAKTTWTYASLAEIEEDVRQALDLDIVHAPRAAGAGASARQLGPDRFIDEWSVQWHKPEGGHYYVEHAPFEEEATVAAVERHPWPEPKDLVNLDGFGEWLRRMRRETDYAISLEIRGRVMSMGQFLRGFENWMMDLADNHAFVEALLEQTTRIQMAINATVLAEAGDLVDIIYTSDDLGSQNGTLCSPATFRKLFRPCFAKIWEQARRSSPACLAHHCCGSIRPLIGEMVELGVQVLNPIQVSAADMDPAELKKQFGRELAFWGGVDTGYVMPRGSVEEVRSEVRRRIREMGLGGGYLCAAVHNIQPEGPPANILAMFEEAKAFGRYPIGQ